MKTAGQPLSVKRGHGSFLELDDGRQIIDCISSWWVTIHGHGNERIADAIHKQALELEQVIFAGFTHAPAQDLTALLLKQLPDHFNRIFFSDNGSTAVEVALKMSFQYWRNLGKPQRKRFIGFAGGYHGDTLGAMSAGGSSGFWDSFRPLMFEIDTIPFPATYDGDAVREQKEAESLTAVASLLSANPDMYAAAIIEPLVQGAAGMKMCSEEYLRKLETLLRASGTLVIFDEVMTGFGRTGEWFACRKAGTRPDIICLSKGITGGFLPLAVTICSEAIYQAFYSDDLEKALFHSHSYTGNPIACAAAVASMNLLSETEDRFLSMESVHRQLAKQYLFDIPGAGCFRHCGTIFAFDVTVEGKPGYFNKNVPELRRKFLDAGLLIRPLGSTVYLMPPYCTDADTMELVYSKVRKVLTQDGQSTN